MQGLVKIQDFMNHLKAEGLVIVRGDELVNHKEAALRNLQRKYMKKVAITYKQVIDAQLLPVTSKQSIQRWVDTGKFKKGEVYETSKGVRMIMTSAIVRLGYVD